MVALLLAPVHCRPVLFRLVPHYIILFRIGKKMTPIMQCKYT